MLRLLDDCSVDAVVTDPPYAIKAVADHREAHRRHGTQTAGPCELCGNLTEPTWQLCTQCLDEVERDMFAGSSMLGMQSANWHETSTHSRGYADNNNAQFGRWCRLWMSECLRVLKPGGHLVAFGGTRTWHRLACAAEDSGFEMRDSLAWLYTSGFPKSLDVSAAMAKLGVREPQTGPGATMTPSTNSQDMTGWGTALKPAHEPIVLARKPLAGTVADTVAAHGTGALNIDGCRIRDNQDGAQEPGAPSAGRWPTNVFLDADRAAEIDVGAGPGVTHRSFWVSKPTQAERVSIGGVSHPTVKPLDLMRELVRLVTPPGGTVLEPFAGSGTTVEACLLEGLGCVAIEQDPSFVPLIKQRVDRRLDPVVAVQAGAPDVGLFALFEVKDSPD